MFEYIEVFYNNFRRHFFFNLLFAALIYFLIKLPSPNFWHYQNAYHYVLGGLLKANLSVIFAVLIGSLINIYLINKWRFLLKGRYFLLRSIASSALGEAVMIIINVILLYKGKLPNTEMLHVVFSDYIVRLIYAVVGVYPANVIVNYLKKNGETAIGIKENSLDPFSMLSNEMEL